MVFRRDIKVHALLDYPLRSLKYLLLAFFLWAIVLNMNAAALDHFIYSPYSMVADIKMLYFFADITPFAFWVLVVLVVPPILLRNFWCRYLCPYGALLGVLSFLSIIKVHRNADTGLQQGRLAADDAKNSGIRQKTASIAAFPLIRRSAAV